MTIKLLPRLKIKDFDHLSRYQETHNTNKGFALVEILVGLAILSIAMISSMRAISSAADTQLAISQRTLALLSADNYLTSIRINRSWPEVGVSAYSCPQLNQAFVCHTRILDTPNPMFRRVEITVYQTEVNQPSVIAGPRLAWLTTVIPNWNVGVL